MGSRSVPAGLVRVTDIRQRIEHNATAPISSTLADASLLIFSVNNTAVRFTMGGTTTVNTGILIKSSDPPFVFDGYDGGSANYLFAVIGTAQVSISGFKTVGSGSRS